MLVGDSGHIKDTIFLRNWSRADAWAYVWGDGDWLERTVTETVINMYLNTLWRYMLRKVWPNLTVTRIIYFAMSYVDK